MRKTLTDRLLRSLKPRADHYDVMDAIVPSMGARVLKSGKISFVLRGRFPSGPGFTRRALGFYGELTLAEARDKARAWLALIERGIDPQEHEDQQRRAAERARQNTFAAVAEDFIRDKLPNERKGREVERDIRREFMPVWGRRPISQITPRDVRDVIRVKAQTAKPQARNLLGYAKRLFGWAVDQDCYGLEVSPAAALKPSKIVGEKVRGDRVLNDAELFALWRAALRTAYPVGPVYCVLMLTALRLNEVADAHWSEFDLLGRVWVIPKERMKGKNGKARAHAVPLTDEALAIFNKLPRFDRGDFLFSTTLGASPVWMTSKAKARVDARMLRTLRAMARYRGDDPAKVTLAPWTNHDIRRSVRSQLSRLKVSEEARQAVLGHARPGIKGTYDLYDYFDEKREALEAWTARLQQIISPQEQVLDLAIDRALRAQAVLGSSFSLAVDATVVPSRKAREFAGGRPRVLATLTDELIEEARANLQAEHGLDCPQAEAVGCIVKFLKSKGVIVDEIKQTRTLVRRIIKGAPYKHAAPVLPHAPTKL